MGTLPKIQHRFKELSWTTEELQHLYDTHTLTQVGYLLGWGRSSKAGINKLLRSHGIQVRPCGRGPNGGNRKGTGIVVPKDELLSGVPDKVLAEKYGLSQKRIASRRIAAGLRKKQAYTDEWLEYNSRARNASEKTYRKHKHILNPDNKPRGKMGVAGAYQLDHIKPLRQCFDEGISPEESAALSNLQFITWQNNLSRRNY